MQVTPSRVFLFSCCALLAGVYVGASFMLPLWMVVLLAIAAVAGIAGSFPWRHPFGSVRWLPLGIGVVVIAFALGMVRANMVQDELYRVRAQLPFWEKIEVVGTIVKYPDIRLDGVRYTAQLQDASRARILVFAQRQPQFSYGDVISVRGKLQAPQPQNGFDYNAFLAKDGIVATLSAGEISKVGERGTIIGRALTGIRAKTEHTIDAILPQQDAALLGALLLGNDGTMTENFKDALNRAGLRHIVAVSGMNITIIVGLLSAFFISLGIRRKLSFIVTVIVIVLFVGLIGAPASAVRAAIMGLLIGVAPIIGRQSSGLRILICAAALMAFLSPLALRADLGFQLSFLAMLGIVLFAMPLTKLFFFLPKTFGLRTIVPMTFAAQLTTLPLLVSAFGRISLVAPLTNLLVLPLLPYATVIGFVVVSLAAVFAPLGSLAAVVIQPYLVFTRFVAEQASTFRFAAWEGLRAGSTFFIAWMVAIVFVAWRIARTKKWPIDEIEPHEANSNSREGFTID